MEMSFRNKTHAGSTKLCVWSPAKNTTQRLVLSATRAINQGKGEEGSITLAPGISSSYAVVHHEQRKRCRCQRLRRQLQLPSRAFLARSLKNKTQNQYENVRVACP
jgi:hypothetical protein